MPCGCAVRMFMFCPLFVAPQVVATYVALSQFSQNVGDWEQWLHCEQMAIQKSSLCWLSREGLLATAHLMQALAYTKLCLGHLDFSIRLGTGAGGWVGLGLAERPGGQPALTQRSCTSLGLKAQEISRYLRKPSLESLVLSVLFRSAFLKKRYSDRFVAFVFVVQEGGCDLPEKFGAERERLFIAPARAALSSLVTTGSIA